MLTKILRSTKRLHYQLEFAKHSGNSKETWKTLQSLINSKQNKDCVPSKLLRPKGDLIEDDKDIAEAFNSFFTEMGEKLCKNIPDSSLLSGMYLIPDSSLQHVPYIDKEMNLDPTNKEELVNIIEGIKNVGAGADNIGAKLFKQSYQAILKPILHLFNVCLESGTFPSIFRVAIINPRPDEVWRVTRPDEGVAQRAPLRIFKSKSRRVKIQTALERSRRTLQDTIMLTLFFDL